MTIPKFVNQLTGAPPVYVPEYIDPETGAQYYTVTMSSFTQQVLPTTNGLGNPTGFGPTSVWGYGGLTTAGVLSNQPGPSFDVPSGTPVYVRYRNDITTPHLFAVDPTLMWANPNMMMMPTMPFSPYPPGYAEAQSPVPAVVHLHGGEVQSTSDGGPEGWFTATGLHGPAYNTELTTWWDGTAVAPNEQVSYYPNHVLPTTLWYHDHGLGITRINVMSGLAGFYFVRSANDTIAPLLPSGTYEVPLVFQDRIFQTNGDLYFPSDGVNPDVHPYWQPEFFGNTIMVNGLIWPNMDVDQGQYRFRLLDGSNARFYNITFEDSITGALLPFTQIGSDGGYLPIPVTMTSLLFAPGERCDVLIDFSGLSAGTKIIVKNSAVTPFPVGTLTDPLTDGTLMRFTVTANPGQVPAALPATLNTIPVLTPTNQRILTLKEVQGPLGPLEVLLNGQKMAAPVSELPAYHSTEDWIIINLTMDAHPIHLHLVQFETISRQAINNTAYEAAWLALNAAGSATGTPPWDNNYVVKELDPTPYLLGAPSGPQPNEAGWKDTVKMFPSEVTIIRARFSP